MSSILKVDQIQLADGSTPTAADLGLNVSNTPLQIIRTSGFSPSAITTTSTSYNSTGISVTITPKEIGSKILIDVLVSMSVKSTGGDGTTTIYMNGSSMPELSSFPLGYVTPTQSYTPSVNGTTYTTTSLDPLTFTLYMRSSDGNIYYAIHNASSYSITATEIAQ